MAIVLSVSFKVKDGQADAFEKHVSGLSKQVLANEPGAKMYQLCRTSEANTYRLIELYDSAEALAAHGQSDHYKAAAPGFAPLLDGRPAIERLETVD